MEAAKPLVRNGFGEAAGPNLRSGTIHAVLLP